MKTLNIVKQSATCSPHVDVEYTYGNFGRGYEWRRSDTQQRHLIVETLHRIEDETDGQFYQRASNRADIIDRQSHCPTCYR